MFIKTKYVHINDSFNDDPDANADQQDQMTNENSRPIISTRRRSPPMNGEQIYLLPYSRLNMYESIILNRNLPTTTYDQWLNDQVTDILAYYTNNDSITHLYAITKYAFTEVRKKTIISFFDKFDFL
jgi:hypothetical protein